MKLTSAYPPNHSDIKFRINSTQYGKRFRGKILISLFFTKTQVSFRINNLKLYWLGWIFIFLEGRNQREKTNATGIVIKKKKTMPLSYLPGGWDLIFFERTQRPAIECTLWIRGLNLASLSAYSNGTNSLRKGIKSLSTSVPGCGLTLKLCK